MTSELARALDDLSTQAHHLAARLDASPSAIENRCVEIVEAVERLTMLLAEAGREPDRLEALCSVCDTRDSCTKSCQQVRDWLRGIEHGRGRREILCASLDKVLQPEGLRMEREVYTVYRNHSHLLTRKQRQAVELYHGEGKTQAETARALGVSRVAVTERLARARKTLQRALTRHYTTLRDGA